ncbi:MAG: response regulator [Nitrospirae bacterium]|nr:response regulator [Nitrospirota bacterium]
MSTVRAIIADDNQKHVKLLKLIIKSLDIDVAGEGANGAEAVRLYRTLRPDVVFLDIAMPVKNGITALREIIAEFPCANVIMITSHDDMCVIDDCIVAGAKDFIRKDAPNNDIKDRIAAEIKAIMSDG